MTEAPYMDVPTLIGILFGAMALAWAWNMPHEEVEARTMCLASEGACGREGSQGVRAADKAVAQVGRHVSGIVAMVLSSCLGICITLGLLVAGGSGLGFWCIRLVLSGVAIGSCLGTCIEMESGRHRFGIVLLLCRAAVLSLSLCCVAYIALP
jgi:hypothetical protein